MTETKPTHCGHDPRFVVSADEGTAYCAMCELEAVREELAKKKEFAQSVISDHIEHSMTGYCSCQACWMAGEFLK